MLRMTAQYCGGLTCAKADLSYLLDVAAESHRTERHTTTLPSQFDKTVSKVGKVVGPYSKSKSPSSQS